MWTNFKYKRDTCSREPSDCIKCQDFISERCIGKEQKDAPKGWIKLKSTASFSNKTLYIEVSKIVGVGHSIKVDNAGNKEVTAVYTLYAENNPWFVDDSIDEVMEKIWRAQNEID